MLCGMLCANECHVMRCKSVGGWCDCGLVVRCVNSLCVCGVVGVSVICVGVCSARHSKRGPESIFYIQSEDILTKRGQNFSPRFVTMCTVLTLP